MVCLRCVFAVRLNAGRPQRRRRAVIARAGAEPELLGFTLIVDDIVYPDGSSSMARLGGGGPQTLWGYQLYHGQQASVALAAGVGPDLPPSCIQWLEASGIDAGALVVCKGAQTPRAWQILEEDGRRHEIWRTPFTEQLVGMLRPPLRQLPPRYQAARSFHVGVHPQDPSLDLLSELREAAGSDGLVSAETFATAAVAVPPADIRRFMSLLDVFSPNEAEAASMLFGPVPEVPQAVQLEAQRLTEPFLEAGAGLVALRRGDTGAVVQDGATGVAIQVPAYPGTAVVDPTGCGNAFCGALLAALLSGEQLAAAAAWGCAAGSLMAEYSGTPAATPAELAQEARRRQAALLALAESL